MDDAFLRLLRSIPRAEKIGTAELVRQLGAKGFEACSHMVQQGLQRLANHFPIECEERNRPYGWRLRSDANPVALVGGARETNPA